MWRNFSLKNKRIYTFEFSKSSKFFLLLTALALFLPSSTLSQTQSTSPDSSHTILNETKSIKSQYLNPELFTYAGRRRYTLNGSLPNLQTKIRPTTTAIIGGVYAGTLVWLHIHQANAWWSGDRGKFHFQEDWVSALQVDKAGHAFGAYFVSYLLSEGFIASGFSWDDATNWGTLMAMLYQTYVEIEDGFAKDWGFSPSDLYADATGSLFFIAQHYVPALQNITPKWQFVPSEWTGKPVINRPRTFIDDYNSSTFWWSVNVHNILPQKLKKYWLPWLDISFGYGADAIDAPIAANGPPDQLASRRYAIGLDYNLVELLPDGGWFWNWFRQTLNYIKLPAPALEFQNNVVRFYLMYPFRISIGNIRF